VGTHIDERSALVADDDDIVRGYLVALLDRLGFSVVQAVDGCEAAQRAREDSFTLIVLDCSMPNLGGLEALPLVRNLQPNAIIVLVSGEDHTLKATELGAHGFIRKGTVSFAHDLQELPCVPT
jgi:CheY-like chemotaxis protein